MRRFLLMCTICLLVGLFPAIGAAQALPRGVVNTAALNMRTQPDPLAPIIRTLPGGTELTIVSTNSDASWYQVALADGAGGWVYSPFIIVRGDMSVVPAQRVTIDRTTLPAALGLVRAIRLNVRSGPSAAFPVLRVAVAGERVSLVAANSNESWYQVRFEDGFIGWVDADFVTFYLGNTADAAEVNIPVPAPAVPSSGALTTAPAITGVINGLVDRPRLNVRPAPDPNTVPITSLGFQTRVTVIGRNGDTSWLQIQAGGLVGWVYAPFVRPNVGNFDNAPVTG